MDVDDKGLRNVWSNNKSKQVKTVYNMAFQKAWLEMEEDGIQSLKATWVQSTCISKMEEAWACSEHWDTPD